MRRWVGSLLKLLGLSLMILGFLGIVVLIIRGGSGAGGYYCLMTIGTAMYLLSSRRK